MYLLQVEGSREEFIEIQLSFIIKEECRLQSVKVTLF